jgi:hypothetical protein
MFFFYITFSKLGVSLVTTPTKYKLIAKLRQKQVDQNQTFKMDPNQKAF